MEKVVIESKIPEIAISPVGRIPEEHEVWEDTDGGAHFIISRHRLLYGASAEFICLSVSGFSKERKRLIGELISAMGEPVYADTNFASNQYQDIVSWVI